MSDKPEDPPPPQRPLPDRRTVASKFEQSLPDYEEDFYDDELGEPLMEERKPRHGRDLVRENYAPPQPGPLDKLEGDSMIERMRPFLIIGLLGAIFIGLVSYFGLKPDVFLPPKSIQGAEDPPDNDSLVSRPTPSSSNSTLNPGVAVLEDNTATMGGYERLKRLASLKARGVIEMDGNEVPFNLYSRRPNYYRLVYTLPDGAEGILAFDGKTLWRELRRDGLSLEREVLPIHEHQRLLQSADFDLPPQKFILVGEYSLDRQARVMKASLFGRDFIEDVMVDIVKIDEEERPYILVYIGSSDNLLKQTETRINGKRYRVVYDDYRKVDGAYFPFTRMQYTDEQLSSVVRFEQLEYNPGIPTGLFSPPTDLIRED